MAEYLVSEGSLRAASATFVARGHAFSARVNAIQSTADSLTATWQGAAAEAFRDYHARWRASASDVVACLTSIGSALELMADHVQAVEVAGTKVWDS